MSRCRRRRDPVLGGFFVLAVALGFLFAYPVPTVTLLALVTFYFVMSARSKRKAAAERARLGRVGWDRYMRERSRPASGADWCDHCAEWTVHQTERHARV